VDLFDDIRASYHQIIAGAEGVFTAIVRSREMECVDAGAHGAIVDQDALAQGFKVGWLLQGNTS